MTLRVDAHHHLWDTAARPLAWMDGPWAEPLRGRFDAADLAAAARPHGIGATVAVQAATEVAETRELLAVCAAGPLVRAVVGWVDLTAPDVADTLAELREGPHGQYLAGIRHPVQDEPDPEWLLRPEVRRGIAAVGAAGLAYDLLVKPPQLPAAVRTVREHPGVAFVLDHLAKPEIAAGPDRPGTAAWAAAIGELAAAPNVAAKLSGLVTEADWRNWTPAQLLPYARRAVDAFGPDRLMFGSDWPVCTLAARYDQVVETAGTLLAELSPDERAAVLGATAAHWYRLD
ncbi:amidohydrolase family protein [Allonocardiopsis opalescens]|uniref:L-fuconolactonase n=1 Tax=Allonocardiopsis opalescens TaxID=1144618 RepID=A0A2T0PXU1_9ACTN|nr:amidohydrolase family protein [Allonocardiopsis opalescens]PRX96268.1 L-fuconolactonase [Allonocardiopsis opalescens]